MKRERVINGLGLVACSIIRENCLGSTGIGFYDPALHLLSTHESRYSHVKPSPFVSFSQYGSFMNYLIEQKWGADPVVVEAEVSAGRGLIRSNNSEFLLVGGLAPEEFVRTHEVDEFTRGD